jgi:SMI1 / KNR4 family (SUKH-1)
VNDPFSDLLSQARDAVTRLGFAWRDEPGTPASPTDLAACETALGQKLPDQFRAFLLRTNGLRITIREKQGQFASSLTFGILELHELIDLNVRKRQTYEIAEEWRNVIAFAGYGTGDYSAFAPVSRHDPSVVDLAHDQLPGEPFAVIATGFDDFIRKTLEALARGREPQYWLDNPLNDMERT